MNTERPEWLFDFYSATKELHSLHGITAAVAPYSEECPASAPTWNRDTAAIEPKSMISQAQTTVKKQ